MTPYKTNKANILYSARQNNISNNNFQIADTCTHCVLIFFLDRGELIVVSRANNFKLLSQPKYQNDNKRKLQSVKAFQRLVKRKFGSVFRRIENKLHMDEAFGS